MANQANWLLNYPEKLMHCDPHSGKDATLSSPPMSIRMGIERRQLQRGLLQYLYHTTVISMGGTIRLLSCTFAPRTRKPSLGDVVTEHLDEFIILFHDR